jgi:adenosine deaminase
VLRPSDTFLRALPKAELHVHLDGSLRPGTLLELATERSVPLPAGNVDALARHMVVADARGLEDYLERFELTLSVMQDAAALERVAYELVEDCAAENVRYVEIRFCPALSTRSGLDAQEVLDAMLRGMDRASNSFRVRARAIVCALRTTDPSVSVEMAELAVANRHRGVVAFDLAGAEAGYPVDEHVDAFGVARRAGVPITVHAGEGYGSPSIRQAIELAHADRIGHGTRLFEDPDLLALVRERRIPLEACVTSNVQTRVAQTYEGHPVRHYFDEGIAVALCTDNRMMSGVTLTDEYAILRDHLGFTADELHQLARASFEHAFTSASDREAMLAEFDGSAEAPGVAR